LAGTILVLTEEFLSGSEGERKKNIETAVGSYLSRVRICEGEELSERTDDTRPEKG
jgi:hypothetical protein